MPKREPDYVLLAAVLGLLAIGTLMVFSASSSEALASFQNPYHFFERQVLWSVLGLGALVVAARINYWQWPRWAFPLFAVAVLALLQGQGGAAAVLLGLAGALLGFLRVNRHPAKVIMGDTGSMAIGGALAAVAVLTHAELWLIWIGGLFVLEDLSVMVQVAYFRRTGRRVLRMSPLHHHFELGGWSEPTLVSRFALASLLLAGTGLLAALAQGVGLR